jgi:hypothetical protein
MASLGLVGAHGAYLGQILAGTEQEQGRASVSHGLRIAGALKLGILAAKRCHYVRRTAWQAAAAGRTGRGKHDAGA